MTEDWEHLEWFEERAAIIEHDGGLPRAEAEVVAYHDWRKIVGSGVKTPSEIVEIVVRARKLLG